MQLTPRSALTALTTLFALVAVTTACSSSQKSSSTVAASGTNTATDTSAAPKFITDIKQVTFDGLRAGEGYFSPDGQSLIFQSEREPTNPFYQIYLMNLKTNAVQRLSPGQGKTSCAWIHPNSKQALFASTHADPDLKKKNEEEFNSRKSDKKTKYSWSFDDKFDIYQVDINGKNLKNLTRSPGYDAEGSYSPDGKWIAFASNRRGYTQPMTADQKKKFDHDPSYMMDLYIMRADGSGVRQLTNTPGYDGGPFFSPDGKHITFRRFTEDGLTAEVHTIAVDGTDDQAITRIKAMSWAPFYHPSGDYLIFTTNKMGYANFELYIVDVKGQHEPVRVSFLDGFDGLPVFTPDGNELYWTHSNEKGEAQIYRAKWSDLMARQALGLTSPGFAPQPKVELALSTLSALRWVNYLASEKMQGRMTGSLQETEYMNELANAFKGFGLVPLKKQYVETYNFTSGLELQTQTNLDIKIGSRTEKATVGEDWTPLSFSSNGQFASAPVVFAGYGIVAPSGTGQAAYDSYADLDVKDKWVLAFSGLPEDIASERRFHLHLYSRLQHKAMMARQRGARGLILIDDSATPNASLKVQFEGRSDAAGIPVLRLSNKLADRIFASEKTSRKQWTQKLAQGEIATLPLTTTAAATVALTFKSSEARNVVAMLKVPGATTSVVVGAHGDHLGHGERGNSLWRGEKNAIHLGADDNASGVAGVLEVAQSLTTLIRQGQFKPKQNIIFAVWSGEELGVLGSTEFLKTHPDLKISGYLNMDMIGRLRDQLMVQGTDSATEWKKWIELVNLKEPMPIRTQEDPYLPSDALSFYMKGIPVLSFFTGSHEQYHMPTDNPDLINYIGLVKTARWVSQMTLQLASHAKPLTYRKVESTKPAGENRGFRLYLGTIPDYSQEGKNGVAISGTSKGSPAEKAGLQPGDVIVQLGGMKIQNLNDYVYCLQALKANVITPMQILRKGVVQNIEITPLLRN